MAYALYTNHQRALSAASPSAASQLTSDDVLALCPEWLHYPEWRHDQGKWMHYLDRTVYASQDLSGGVMAPLRT